VTVDIRLTDDIDAAVQRIEGGAEHLVAQLAMRVRDVAKGNLHVGYGVDTGAMQESISAVTSEGSDYADHVANAAEMNPRAQFAPEPQLEGPLEAFTVVPVDYAAHNEFGGRNPAIPFLTPAMELVASHADDIAREVFDLEGVHRS
jgi:hypothetical protein